MDKLLKELIDLSKPRYTHNPSGAPLTAQDIVQEMNNHRSPLYQQFFSQLTYEYNVEIFIKQALWEQRIAAQYDKEILLLYELEKRIAKSKLPIYNDQLDEDYDREVLEKIVNQLIAKAKSSISEMLGAVSKMQNLISQKFEVLQVYNKAKSEALVQYYTAVRKTLEEEIKNCDSEETKQKLSKIVQDIDYLFNNKDEIINDIRERRFNGQDNPTVNELIEQIYNDTFHDIMKGAHQWISNGHEFIDEIGNNLKAVDDQFQPIIHELDGQIKTQFSDILKNSANLECITEEVNKLGKVNDLGKAIHNDLGKLNEAIKGVSFNINIGFDNDNKHVFNH